MKKREGRKPFFFNRLSASDRLFSEGVSFMLSGADALRPGHARVIHAQT